MDIKELLWKYFNLTGCIGSYLLLKQIEYDIEVQSEVRKEESNGAGIYFHRSDCDKEDGF